MAFEMRERLKILEILCQIEWQNNGKSLKCQVIGNLPLLDSLYLPCWLSKYEPFSCPKYLSIVLGLIP